MVIRSFIIFALLVGLAGLFGIEQTAIAQESGTDWNQMYHYPYVYYPQNSHITPQFKGFDHPYHRYPDQMRIPEYNHLWASQHSGFKAPHYPYKERIWLRFPAYIKNWINFYPKGRKYHKAHHFILDVF